MRRAATLLLTLALVAAGFSDAAVAAGALTRVSDTLSTAAVNVSATHVIRFTTSTALQAGDTIEVNFSPLAARETPDLSGISTIEVDGASDGTFETTRTLGSSTAAGDTISLSASELLTVTLSSVSGGIPAGATVRLTVDTSAKLIGNPSTAEYTISLATRRAGAALDLGMIAVYPTRSVAVTAKVGSASANPTIGSQFPSGTVVLRRGTSRTVRLTLADQEDDAVTYTVTPDVGAVSSGIPSSPLASGTTTAGSEVAFTYFAPAAAAGSVKYIIVTADDGVSPTAGVTSHSIPVWVY